MALEGLHVSVIAPDMWTVSFQGPRGTVYEDEPYTLQVKFTVDYPMDSPEVVFQIPSPSHAHIYSNGHICLNILGDDWSPALTVKTICLSVISMLSSATEKSRPPDDERYSRAYGNSSPKKTKFMYHDDTV